MKRFRRFRIAVSTLLYVAAGACAPGSVVDSGQGAWIRPPWHPPAGQSCPADGAPPTLAAAVDLSALARSLDPEIPRGSVLLYVPGQRSQQSPPRAILEGVERPLGDSVQLLDTDLSDAQAEGIRSAALRHLTRYEHGYLIRIDHDDGVRASTWASIECPPALRNRTELAQALARVQAPPGSWTAQVDVLVAEDGAVIRSLITRSSGNNRVDAEMLRIAETMRFSPALLNGIPVRVAVSLPLSIRG